MRTILKIIAAPFILALILAVAVLSFLSCVAGAVCVVACVGLSLLAILCLLAGELRDTEAALAKTSELMGAVVQYAKTRPVFDGYKAARYSRKYLAQHEAELADYRAAKAAMSELLGGAKLPKMDTLKKQHRELSEKKKALYAEYRKAQADMRQAVAVKANIDHLLGHADEQKNKAQER